MASKADIIDKVSDKAGISRTSAKDAVEQVLNAITGYLQQGEKVQLTGFGTFEVRERKERSGVKPGTTERITIPASKYPAFKLGKLLKEEVSGKNK